MKAIPTSSHSRTQAHSHRFTTQCDTKEMAPTLIHPKCRFLALTL